MHGVFLFGGEGRKLPTKKFQVLRGNVGLGGGGERGCIGGGGAAKFNTYCSTPKSSTNEAYQYC